MASLSEAAVRRRLRHLDPGDLTRFVGALWAATGWNTAVRGRRVVARRRDPPERCTLRVVGSASDLAGLFARPPVETDRIVAPVGDPLARVIAARTDRSVVAAADLHERLTYAVPDGDRERLLERYMPPRTESPVEPTRRAVLGAVAAGMAVVGAGGVAPRSFDRSVPPEERWYSLPEPPSRSDVSKQSFGCGVQAREAVLRQLAALRRHESVTRSVTGGPDLPPGGEDAELSDAFRDAVAGAGPPSLRSASVTEVLDTRRDGRRVIVPVRGATANRHTVLYAVILRQSEDCWRVVDVRVARDLPRPATTQTPTGRGNRSA